MFNVGGPEVLVILLLALIVLGPQRLPDAARQLGKARAELRRLSSGFQDELRTAFDDESDAAARARGAAVSKPPSPAPPSPVPPPAVPPPAAIEPAGPDEDPPKAAPRPRRRTTPLRADRPSAEPPAP